MFSLSKSVTTNTQGRVSKQSQTRQIAATANIRPTAFSRVTPFTASGPSKAPCASRRTTLMTIGASGLSSSVVAAAGATGASAPSSNDLLVVGPGVLGGYLGKLWKDAFPGSTVYGLTNSTNNHERCACMGGMASNTIDS